MNATLRLRDALSLTAALAMVAAPHATRLPWWLTLLVVTLVGWRVYIARAGLLLPSRALLVAVVIGAAAGIYLFYGTLFGRDAGVALLVMMLTLKLLETRTHRDAMLLVFLGYFLVITNFLYSQTIPTALYMVACVWVITACMTGLHYKGMARHSAESLRTAAVLLLQSVPLTLALFVLFPRVQGPLWGMPSDARGASTGLSDGMTPGSLSHLTLSDAVAFRVTFKSRVPPAQRLYWRGPVLWDFDGTTWRAPRIAFSRPSYRTQAYAVDYTVTVEPHGKSWLFALDLPAYLPQQSIATADFQIIASRPVTTRQRYDMESFLDYSYGLDESKAALQRALALPAGFNPRALTLAQELRRKYPSDGAYMRAVLARFTREGYSYTLAPPVVAGDSVDAFLFGTKRGFCEHYASAFAVLMRAAGIPARIVTGYLGGEMNPLGNYLIVRQADAHAWTEVWLPNQGWIRIDPTAAVSPARIEQGINAAVDASAALPLFVRTDLPLLRDLGLTWDSIANTWNQWVLGYTPERQRALLTRVGLDDATWHTLAAILLIVTGVIILVLALITLRRLRVNVRDPVRLAYSAFCAKLHSCGLTRGDAEGPLSYAERVSRARPELQLFVQRFIALYVRLRYDQDTRPEDVRLLQQLAREFKP